jgi:hypothetical protein
LHLECVCRLIAICLFQTGQNSSKQRGEQNQDSTPNKNLMNRRMCFEHRGIQAQAADIELAIPPPAQNLHQAQVTEYNDDILMIYPQEPADQIQQMEIPDVD